MKKITEKDGLQNEWYERAKKISNEKELTEFINELTTKYEHDYGTICHAIAAAAIGAAWCVDRSPQGGITGFQAGAIMWQFIQVWNSGGSYNKNPLRLLDYGDLLYPQYEYKFKAINADTWKWVREQANELLKSNNKEKVDRAVWLHWDSIRRGIIPFGLTVEEENK